MPCRSFPNPARIAPLLIASAARGCSKLPANRVTKRCNHEGTVPAAGACGRGGAQRWGQLHNRLDTETGETVLVEVLAEHVAQLFGGHIVIGLVWPCRPGIK